MFHRNLSRRARALAAVACLFCWMPLTLLAAGGDHVPRLRTSLAAGAAPKFIEHPAPYPEPYGYPGFSYATHAYGAYSTSDFVANPIYTGAYNASVNTLPQPVVFVRPSSPPPVWGFPAYSGGYYDTWRWHPAYTGVGYGPRRGSGMGANGW